MDPFADEQSNDDSNASNDIETPPQKNDTQSSMIKRSVRRDHPPPTSVSTPTTTPNLPEDDTDTDKRALKPPPPRWFTVLYYLCLSTTALLLTLLARGTRLWIILPDPENTPPRYLERGTVNLGPLVRLVGAYLGILLGFYAVQGSDPGYIDGEVMARVCQGDGLDLIGHERLDDGGSGNADGGGTPSDDTDEEAAGTLLPQIEMTPLTTAAAASSATLPRKRNKKTSSLVLDDGFESGDDTGDESSPLDLSPTPLTTTTTKNPYTTVLKRPPSVEPYRKRRRKLCPMCSFSPPLRAHHCRVCDRCVSTFDHHCHFIGTCIGERNHCRFWWFLTFQTFGFVTCIGILGSSPLGWWKGGLGTRVYEEVGTEEIVMLALSKAYVYGLGVVSVIMWVIHTGMALTNTTSFELGKGAEHLEYLRGTRECDVPFGRGLCGNLRLFCCVRDRCCAIGARLGEWRPMLWRVPDRIERDSEDWWAHPWQNKYWSCC